MCVDATHAAAGGDPHDATSCNPLSLSGTAVLLPLEIAGENADNRVTNPVN
jgi:hypothetical protein